MTIRLTICLFVLVSATSLRAQEAPAHFERFCIDCHDDITQKGNLDLVALLGKPGADRSIVFENLITGKMPPKKKRQPSAAQRAEMLAWLASHEEKTAPNAYRRISRHEFVHSVNDLLGIRLDVTGDIPEDRNTHEFDTNRNILLTRQQMSAYFTAADRMLDFALPDDGYEPERTWVTSTLMDSNPAFRGYVRTHKEGLLFSWIRQNNGTSYSFFYDNFNPPVAGWYDLTFEAAKMGAFEEDISIAVFAGKWYLQDDRPQPQRVLDVISLSDRNVKPYTIRAFLRPGESVSVHCYSKHTYGQSNGEQGAYIKQLTAKGPVFEQWPPKSYRNVFEGLALDAPRRRVNDGSDDGSALQRTALQRIGGSLTVSSFQKGMEKEKMQDGSNRTFWHTRFKPTVAKPPHFVVIENPAGKDIVGLSYATWTGGNGNGQVKSYAIHVSDDGEAWGDPIMVGELETRLTAEQRIVFPDATSKRFIKFLVTDAVSLDGKSLASVGKLDVLVDQPATVERVKVAVRSGSPEDLKRVIKRFAQRAFASTLGDDELAPYFEVGLDHLQKHGDFVLAAKAGFKAIVCSHRFLLAPGFHANNSYARSAALARALWLSVPDQTALDRAAKDRLAATELNAEIDRMLGDPRSGRMIRSFAGQWLNLRSFDSVAPSLKLYPGYGDLLNHYLPIETEAYLAHLIERNLPTQTLIDSDFSILNQRLAQHYGVAGVLGQRMRKVALPDGSPRGGLMTMGSVLKVTTDGIHTSPILRGAWIAKNVAGVTLSPPPADVEVIEADHAEGRTLKEQIEEHKKSKTCYACHKSIDPYGFALESFDAIGKWRTRYSVETPHRGTFQYRPQGYFRLTGPVDASGDIGGAEFTDVVGMKKIMLSDHKRVAYNFAKKFFEYASGTKPDLNQRLRLYEMIPDDPDACRLRDLISDVLVYAIEGTEP